MLTQITINNFTIIDSLELDFESGFTVFTGETGAGKSIIIDAMELALGKRANANIVRHNQNRADITVQFDISENSIAQEILYEHELSSDNECIIRRSISSDGKSKSFVNGIPVTLNVLQKLAEPLVNIHGQHEFQTLLKNNTQREMVDQFADLNKLSQTVMQNFTSWVEAKNKLIDAKNTLQRSLEKQDFLTFQIKELDELNLHEDELAEIESEHKQLANADTILANANLALEILTEIPLHKALNSITTIQEHHNKLATASELINSGIIQTQEAANEIKLYLDNIELDPEKLNYLENRLGTIHQLARKHRVEPNALPTLHLELQSELAEIENSDEIIQQLEKNVTLCEKAYFQNAKELSQKRIKAAKELSDKVTEKMHLLNMQGGQFSISLEPQNPNAFGLEKINFLVTTNSGSPLMPLNKVASGGELSRISLAIQVIAAQKNATPTLIFDEVDVGIGGGTAEIVGALLKQLGSKTQVLCVTHLGQVAAKGKNHLIVAKIQQDNATVTSLKYLSKDERANEIARMIGGINITKQTLAHAEEMLG